MKAISIIIGVLMVIGGFCCMFTPLATFLYTGYFLGILMFVYGVLGIIKAAQKRSTGLEIILSILALVVGIVAIVRPGSTLVFDRMILIFIAIWLLFQGVSSIVLSVQFRAVKSTWVLGVIIGILAVILGCYSFAHPMFTAVTAGFLIGFYFLETGLNMIILAVAVGRNDGGSGNTAA